LRFLRNPLSAGDRTSPHFMSQVLKRPPDPSVAPSPILFGHSQDQFSDLPRCAWSARSTTGAAIILGRDQPKVPLQKRFWAGYGGNAPQSIPPELLFLSGQSAALVIGESRFFVQLFPEDFHLFPQVFDDQLLVAVEPTCRQMSKRCRAFTAPSCPASLVHSSLGWRHPRLSFGVDFF